MSVEIFINDNMKKKKILITGAAGYIGSMLTTKLVELGYDILAVDILKYDDNSLSHLFFFENFNFIKADITKKNVIKKIIKNCEYIIPLAGLVGAPLCNKYKKEAINVNLKSIEVLLKYKKKNQKIIYPTTNSGYGIGEKNKFCNESSILKPLSLYGLTKAAAEKMILKNKNVITFRLATVFGYSYRMRTDLIVNNFVENAVKTKNLRIFEPHFRRNFIHIRDVVSAFVFAIKNFNKLKGETYNLGLSSANITKLELAKQIKKEIKNVNIKILKNQKDPDKRDYFVSNKKIEKKGFKAKINLKEGIRELKQLFLITKKNYKNNY
jgi:nucleoside-diphosphate-sugar epimerase